MTMGFRRLAEHLLSPIFVEFYESYRQWVFDQFGPADKWPEVWRFARVIRNALSHGGKVSIERKNERPVKWRNTSYSYANNGEQVIHEAVSVGDLIVLMFDLDDALDEAGCPQFI
jgi:hypothetical protein